MSLYVAPRLNWLALEIVPRVRGLGWPRPDHRSELFRRRVDPQVSTAIESGALLGSARARGRRGWLPIRPIPAG